MGNIGSAFSRAADVIYHDITPRESKCDNILILVELSNESVVHDGLASQIDNPDFSAVNGWIAMMIRI